MNVLLISQCDKRALSETRRILDQFAERRGDRTWQTPITQIGLDTLRKLLRKTARKNTAVACHWIRGRDHSELLWIVGDAKRFNAEGAVPTDTTVHNVLRRDDENDWHSADIIGLLSQMAALWHDFGKANDLFQAKLRPNAPIAADPFRHEWISLRLFEAFVGNDDDPSWLSRLHGISGADPVDWLARVQSDASGSAKPPFQSMPPIARAVGWLVLTHHRLPSPHLHRSTSDEVQFERLWCSLDASWCSPRADASQSERARCWQFELGLPSASPAWCARASKLAGRMLKRLKALSERDWLQDPFVAHVSRAALMMADHQYSAEPGNRALGDAGYLAHANTDGDGQLKQRLDEHLVGVANYAGQIAGRLPQMHRALGRLASRRAFSQRATDERYRWQDRAFDLAVGLQRRSSEQGFFGVNMASTGCGKTLANARVMVGLAHPQQGARFCVALGLRTLTLQTGDAYRDRLRLSEQDLAVMIGSTAVRGLHEQARQEDQRSGRGSSSAQPLIDDLVQVRYEGASPGGVLGAWLKRTDSKLARLLEAPVLVCTIDHLMPASEATRGGRQIAPILRLLTSDLVLDEPDDFDIDDLPALTRLVHFAGLFGSRVLLASATLTPAIVQGLFAAYLDGRTAHQRNRGRPGLPIDVCCAWFDEYGCAQSQHGNEADFSVAHNTFVSTRLRHIEQQQQVRRRAHIVPVEVVAPKPRGKARELANQIQRLAAELHSRHHEIDPKSGKRVSIGLIRFANIDPLIDIARLLFALDAPAAHRLHICVYHSRFPLILRSNLERRLDRLLARHRPGAIFENAELRVLLDTAEEPDQVFMILASPVAEVGRDHDYDWAIVEPSSMRSIIQLAGRVRRHRVPSASVEPNIALLDRNWRDLNDPHDGVAFCYPGFEKAGSKKRFLLSSHRLSEVLSRSDYDPLTSAPRITERALLDARRNLVDLEHLRLRLRMLEQSIDDSGNVRRWWMSAASLTAFEQARTPFRRAERQETFVLAVDEDQPEGCAWRLLTEYGQLVSVSNRVSAKPIVRCGMRTVAWGASSYLDALVSIAANHEAELNVLTRKFGVVQLPALVHGSSETPSSWQFDPCLGLRRDPET